MQNNITVSADFGGGLDIVFDGKTEIKLEIGLPATVSSVIRELADRHANHKKDMFAINGIM
jgi:hypothetical protein